MQQSQGLFIVIEGSDGSGKKTQFNLLKERLRATGYDVAIFDFPRYNKESSYFVRQYLDGKYGPSTNISPYTSSFFYALDRFEASKDIRQALDEGKIVLSNRYVGSNMAHQGAKFVDPVEQRGFFVWEDNLEYQLLQIPRPNVSFFLRVPAEISHTLIKERAAKNNLKLDGHEADFNFLKKSLATFDTLCQLFPKDFKAIECTKNGEMLSIPQISDLIWKRVKPLLPSEKQHPSHSVVVSLTHDAGGQESNEGSANELVHVFKNASLLLRLLLQRNLQVNTYPDFRTWSDSGYTFYTPQGMAKNLASNYKATFERYVELNQQLQQKLGQYMERHILTDENLLHQSLAKLILPLTPLGALTSFKARIDKKSVRHVCAQLLSNDSQEVQWAAKQLYVAARQKWPDYFSEPLESSDGPVAVNNILAKLVDERLPHNITSSTPVKLLEAHPRLEFDLLAESIYPHTSLSLEEIREEVSNWPYQQKFQSFQQAATNDEILHKVRYKLDIISNQITINNFIEAGRLKDTQVQAFTPRYGFEVPQIFEEAGIDDIYNEVFDESVRLYSLLQAGDCAEQAAYATLLGHKARWQITADGKSLAEIIKKARSDDAVIVKDVNELVAEVHPLLWEILSGHGPSNQTAQKNGKSRVKPYHQRTAKKKKKQS